MAGRAASCCDPGATAGARLALGKEESLAGDRSAGLLVMTAAALVGEATRLELRTAVRNEQFRSARLASCRRC